jgi:hypothetical protein
MFPFIHEGTANDFETTFSVADPTADRAISFPDAGGEVSLLGQSIADAEVDDNITLTNITQITNRSHTSLGDIGSNTHAQIDTHIAIDHEEEAHASEHQNAGADEVATATPGANAIPKAEADGDLNAGWIGQDQAYTWTAKHDFGEGTVEIPNSTTLPGTCAVGDSYMDTDATSGQRFYLCESTDTWALQGDGAGGGSGDITTVGTCTTGDCAIEGGNDMFPFIYEGTANDFETTFQVTDPTADRTLTFPNVTTTFVGGGETITTAGAVPFVSATGGVLAQDGTNLFWDNSAKELGIGTNSPTQELELVGDLELEKTTSNDTGVVYKSTNAWLHDFSHPTGDTAVPVGHNVFLGDGAGNFTMGSTATSISHGSYNIAIGYNVFTSNVKGYYNIAMGEQALSSNTDGARNFAFGRNSMQQNTTGHYNVAVGNYSLRSNTTGASNIALGYNAGRYQANGSTSLQTPETSIYIGRDTKGKDNDDDNSVVIGYNATGQGANTVVVGNGSTTTTFLNHTLAVGPLNTSPTGTLHVYDATATTGTTDVTIALGAADSATDVTLTNAGTTKSAGYQSSDGSAGVTVSTCTSFKNGLCVAGT